MSSVTESCSLPSALFIFSAFRAHQLLLLLRPSAGGEGGGEGSFAADAEQMDRRESWLSLATAESLHRGLSSRFRVVPNVATSEIPSLEYPRRN